MGKYNDITVKNDITQTKKPRATCSVENMNRKEIREFRKLLIKRGFSYLLKEYDQQVIDKKKQN